MEDPTELSDTCLMPWGKYEGVPMIDVPADYLLQMYDSNKCCQLVKNYITDNKDVLEFEIPKPKPTHIYY